MYVVYINLLYFLSIFLFTYNKNLLSQKKPRGRPTTTWLKKISSDLSETNIQLNPQNATPQQILENLKTRTSDRNQWKKQIRVVMDDNHPNVHLGSPE